MPPPGKGKPLSRAQIATLKQWIDEGAQWPDAAAEFDPRLTHWAFKRPVELTQQRTLDGFVFSKMAEHGLSPAPQASRSALLRRLSLDLIGLPPTLAELDAFDADPGAGAYEKQIDRLLSSPHYGEKWARWWLDLARYADSNGYDKDEPRVMWLYRDWVIQAFNQNMPFDQFTLEQLAGDLLPNPTNAQLIASGFHRNTMFPAEGGVDKEEFRIAAVVDRVDTTATVWMGLTLACAQCHDHKFDPVSQKEYYQFFAYFNNTDDKQINIPGKASALVTSEPQKMRETRIHIGGDFLNKGAVVQPGVPAFLPPLPPLRAGEKPGRLQLARWLTAPEHPLTARAIVNQIWAEYFGRGLVASLEDLGTQCDGPTHSELLDWLALRLIESKWDLKALHRVIVSSATYRQVSNADAAALKKDPGNDWLARGARFRLPAETIRDTALAASGLLAPEIGGPSVNPPQPPGIWEGGFNDFGNKKQRAWSTDTGANRFRRGLYTFIRRTVPYPAFVTFDAPRREVSCSRRPRTNTPLQALTLMNDEAFFELAQGLGQRLIKEGGASAEERITLGFKLCVSRPPSTIESERLLKLLNSMTAHFSADAEAARKVAVNPMLPKIAGVTESELAAWTMLASALLNLDETITKQ